LLSWPRQGSSDSGARGGALSVEDRQAIQEVIAQYSYTYDSQDAEGFARLFAEDGVFEVFVQVKDAAVLRLQSQAAIHAWAGKRLGARRGVFTSRHHQSGTLFEELTSASAKSRTMVLVTHQRLDEALPRLELTGVYRDLWIKTAQGWRFAHRAAYVDRDPELLV
jgi:ketosteroid isomerase-like protein